MQTKESCWILHSEGCQCGGICPGCSVDKEMKESLAVKILCEETFEEYLNREALEIK